MAFDQELQRVALNPNLDSVGYGPDNPALPEGTFPPRG